MAPKQYGGGSSWVSSELHSYKQNGFEEGLFHVMFVMVKDNPLADSFVLFVLFVDFFQWVGFSFDPSVPWGVDNLQYYLNFFQFPLVFFGFELYAAALILSLLCAFYVAQSFNRDRFHFIFPLKILRFFVLILITVLYIPVLMYVKWCSRCSHQHSLILVQMFVRQCALLSAMSIVVLVFFIPFALTMSLVYFESNVTVRNGLARPHGRLEFLALFYVTALTIFFEYFDDMATEKTLLLCFCQGSLMKEYVYKLPFYSRNTNKLRIGLYGAQLELSLLSLFVSYYNRPDELWPFYLGCALLIPAFLLGWFIAHKRYDWVDQHWGPVVHMADIAANLLATRGAARKLLQRTSSGRQLVAPHTANTNQSQSQTLSTSSPGASLTVATIQPPPQATPSESGNNDESSKKRPGLFQRMKGKSETNVEGSDGKLSSSTGSLKDVESQPAVRPNVARLVHQFSEKSLAVVRDKALTSPSESKEKDKPTSRSSQQNKNDKKDFSRSASMPYMSLEEEVISNFTPGNNGVTLPGDARPHRLFKRTYDVDIATRFVFEKRTQQSLQHATLLFEAGIKQFQNSAYIHFVYSSFLYSYKRDLVHAARMMNRCKALSPPFDIRFLLFKREKEWSQDRNQDIISSVEYQKDFLQATQSHQNAIENIRKFWAALLPRHVDLATLPRIAQNINQAEQKSEVAYERLLTRHNTDKFLLRKYGHFLEHVKNDPEMADYYYEKADFLEEETMLAVAPNASNLGSHMSRKSSISRHSGRKMSSPALHKKDKDGDDNEGDDHSDDRSDTSGHSGTRTSGAASKSETATRVSSRRRNIYRQNILQQQSVGIRRLKFYTSMTVLLFLTVQVLLFTFIHIMSTDFQNGLDDIRKSGQRPYFIQSAALYSTGMQLGASYSLLDYYNTSRSFLKADMLALDGVQQILVLKAGGQTSTILDLLTVPSLVVRECSNGTGMAYFNDTYNLMDAGTLFTGNALRLLEEEYVAGRTITSLTCSQYHIMVNGPLDHAESFRDATHGYRDGADGIKDTMLMVSIGIVGGAFFLLMIVLFLVFLPVFKHIQEERTDVLRLFLNIPKSVVLRMYRATKSSEFTGDDVADESPDAEEVVAQKTSENDKEEKELQEEVTPDSDQKDELAHLTLKNSLAFFLILLIMGSTVAALMVFVMDQVPHIPAEMEAVCELRMLLHRLRFLSNELLVPDQYSFTWTEANVRALMLEDVVYVRKLHFGLKYGDSARSLPGYMGRYEDADDLVLGRNCVDNDKLCTDYGGLDRLMSRYLDAVQDLAYIPASGLADLRAVGPLSARLREVNDWESLYLDGAVDKLLYLFRDESKIYTTSLIVNNIIFLLLNVLSMAALWVLFFRRTIIKLQIERTHTSTMLLMIPHETIQKVPEIRQYFQSGIGIRKKEVEKKLVESVKIFQHASETLVSALANKLKLKVYAPRSYIIKEGGEGDAMYFLVRGTVEILINKGEKSVGTQRAGSCFGEIALLTGERRTASIRCVTMCDVFVLTRKSFYKVLRKFPQYLDEFRQMAEERKTADTVRKQEEQKKAEEKAAAGDSAPVVKTVDGVGAPKSDDKPPETIKTPVVSAPVSRKQVYKPAATTTANAMAALDEVSESESQHGTARNRGSDGHSDSDIQVSDTSESKSRNEGQKSARRSSRSPPKSPVIDSPVEPDVAIKTVTPRMAKVELAPHSPGDRMRSPKRMSSPERKVNRQSLDLIKQRRGSLTMRDIEDSISVNLSDDGSSGTGGTGTQATVASPSSSQILPSISRSETRLFDAAPDAQSRKSDSNSRPTSGITDQQATEPPGTSRSLDLQQPSTARSGESVSSQNRTPNAVNMSQSGPLPQLMIQSPAPAGPSSPGVDYAPPTAPFELAKYTSDDDSQYLKPSTRARSKSLTSDERSQSSLDVLVDEPEDRHWFQDEDDELAVEVEPSKLKREKSSSTSVSSSK